MITIPLAAILAEENFSRIRAILLADGLIAYPTDTLYGLGGNFLSLAVHERMDALKGRNAQPYSAAVGGMVMLESLVAGRDGDFPGRLRSLLPGQFTFLFRPAAAIDPRLVKGSGRIGVRMPDLPLLLKLITGLGFPLITTSANRGGLTPLNDPLQIAREFPDLDLLIDGGTLPPSQGSTVVDLTRQPPQVIRAGADLNKWLEIFGRGAIWP